MRKREGEARAGSLDPGGRGLKGEHQCAGVYLVVAYKYIQWLDSFYLLGHD